MQQPARHVELFTMYLQVKSKVKEGDQRRLESQANRVRSKVRR